MAKDHVTEDLADSITKHSIELQRVGNRVGGELGREYKTLADKLSGLVVEFDLSNAKTQKAKKKRLKEMLRRGRVYIDESHLAIAQGVRENLIDVADLEDTFSTGSVNKALTGKGTVKVVTSGVPPVRLSKIADDVIVQGVPQRELWNRHGRKVQEKFKDAIRAGYANNEDIGTISARIRGTSARRYKDGIMNVSKNQADTLARTSIMAVSNQVRVENYEANNDVIKGVKYLSTLDSRTTEICVAHSGDEWELQSDGSYKNVKGGHAYVQPPLHYNCRSTLLPLIRTKDELPKAVTKKIPKERLKTAGKSLPSAKYKDADAWLKTQPEDYQKSVLGSLHSAWQAGRISASRLVSQKGRLRTPDEVRKQYLADDLVPDEIVSLKTEEKFKIYKGAPAHAAKEIGNVEKGKFLNLEEKLVTGRAVSRDQSDLVGKVLRYADPEELEYKGDYTPAGFKDLLGTKGKRVAFYNHTAKRFERISDVRKGDLKNRKTGPLDDEDKIVLRELHEKIHTDKAIPDAHKKILLDVYDESKKIIGTQRAITAVDSLRTLARKENFLDIGEGKFVGYLNNAQKNSVNAYFSRRRRVEIKTGETAEKAVRFKTVSDVGKSKHYRELNSKGVKLGHAGELRRRIEKVGSRKLRDWEGAEPTTSTIDLELSPEETIGNYLSNINTNNRLSASQQSAFFKRLDKPEQKLVIQRTNLGDDVVFKDSILKNKLFGDFQQDIWSGRGLSPQNSLRAGEILGDVQTYQDLREYLRGKIVIPDGVDADDFIKDVIQSYGEKSTLGKTSAIKDAEKQINKLFALPGKKRRELRAARAKAADKRFAEKGFFARLSRKRQTTIDKEKVLTDRDQVKADFRKEADGKYVEKISTTLDDKIVSAKWKVKDVNYQAANVVSKADPVELARMVNTAAYRGISSGANYTDVIKKLGRDAYYKYKGVLEPDDADALRLGHFLLSGVTDNGYIERLKTTALVRKFDWEAPTEEITWLLKPKDPQWENAVLSNRKNYFTDDLPYIDKPPKYKDGFLENGTSAVRGADREWVKKKFSSKKSKGATNNLNYEAGTGIKVNGYIYDVQTELIRRNKGTGKAIPQKPLHKKDVSNRSSYDSFNQKRALAKSLRDETFYNGFSHDRYARTYATNSLLHWQGDDISRGLIQFAKGVKLGKHGEAEFARNFINIAGFDKIPIKERVKLLNKIDEKLILKTAKDPIKYDWWYTENDWVKKGIFTDLDGIDPRDIPEIKKLASKADPSGEGAYQFLALIEERARQIQWKKKGKRIEDFVSHTPSQRDGTTNVLQHFAGISRDRSIAQSVNMTRQRGVADAYIKTRDALEDLVRDKYRDSPYAKYVLIDDLTHAQRRKSVKKGLMT